MDITVPFAYQAREKPLFSHNAAKEMKAKSKRAVAKAYAEANQANKATGQQSVDVMQLSVGVICGL